MATDTAVASPREANFATGSARERILEQALVLFSVRGFADVSMKEIADAVGITKAALYYHFTGKEELFAHSFAHEVETVRQQILEIVTRDSDLHAAVYDLAILFLDRGHRDMRQLQQDFLSFVSEKQREELFANDGPEHALLRSLTDFFERHQASGDVRDDIAISSLIPLIFGMVHVQRKTMDRLAKAGTITRSNAQIANDIAEIILYGVVPR